MIDKAAAIAVRHRGQSFAKVFGVRELQRDLQLAGPVDVSPPARIGNQAEVGNSLLTNVDGGQAFGKIVDDIELRPDCNLAGRVDEHRLAVGSYQSKALMKIIRAVELQWNDDLSRAIDEPKLAVLFHREESLRPGLLTVAAEGAKESEQQRTDKTLLWNARCHLKLSILRPCSRFCKAQVSDKGRPRIVQVYRERNPP